MSVYLERFPPARAQFHKTRTARVTGCIVVHDAENVIDLQGEDTGAEGVASFIRNRTDAGSYHDVVDSDSRVQLGRYEWTMFHCVGANSWTTSVSFACRTDDFRSMPSERLRGFLKHGAEAAVDQIEWYAAQGIQVPLRRLTAAEAKAGKPGFVDHARMDPGRRSDPGIHFPWVLFFEAIQDEQARRAGGDDEMAKTWNLTDFDSVMRSMERIYKAHGRADDKAGLEGWEDRILETLRKHEDPNPHLEWADQSLGPR